MTDKSQTGNYAEITPHSVSTAKPDGRISVKGSLLERAKHDDLEALKTIFHQFIPKDEEITFAEYYGYTGFMFVGKYSFACLTNKRVASLQVGPFKKIRYEDGFFENMTSGGIYQPSKFWLYIFLFFGFFMGWAFFSYLVFGLLFFAGEFFGMIDTYYGYDPQPLMIFSGLVGFFLIPFIMNAIIAAFYRVNPCGLACWVRERYPVYVSVSRDKMLKANRLYRMWSDLRDQRMRFIKNKMKNERSY